jgi:hypothetical protein
MQVRPNWADEQVDGAALPDKKKISIADMERAE